MNINKNKILLVLLFILTNTYLSETTNTDTSNVKTETIAPANPNNDNKECAYCPKVFSNLYVYINEKTGYPKLTIAGAIALVAAGSYGIYKYFKSDNTLEEDDINEDDIN